MSGGATPQDERRAEAAALAQVAAMFQRPSQLEKLDVLQKRADRKKQKLNGSADKPKLRENFEFYLVEMWPTKRLEFLNKIGAEHNAAVEAMLRTGIQSQLEGIRSAIGHLQSAGDDIAVIETKMSDVRRQLEKVPALASRMSRLSHASATHSQYAAAVENLKHLLNIGDTVERAHQFIADGRLLHAHKHIMELENARDDLMFEVHKLRSDRREYDKNLLKNYFVDVEQLALDLGKQISYVCSRALEMVCGAESAPHQLVSALRIIEREERIDQYYEEQASMTNRFMPPGRPRHWRRQLFDTLLKNVRHRVEGGQFEDGAVNRASWLARYLEICRRTVVEDLKVVRSGLVPCFPPEYNIYDRYIKYYHDSITQKIREIAAEALEKNELVQLLSWIQAYPGETILGTPRLGIQATALVAENPLLSKSTTSQLYDRYIELTRRDISEWLNKALLREKDDWYNHELPERDANDCFYTQLPSILFGMVDDSVAISKEFSVEIVPRVIDVGVDEFHNFFLKYKEATLDYKNKHFEDRAFFAHYTSTMISIANNLDICNESTDKLEKHIRLTMESSSASAASTGAEESGFAAVNRQELIQKIDQLKKKWNYGTQFAIAALLDEIFQDISKHMEQLMTRSWMIGSADLETICITVSDYFGDYKHLRSHLRYSLIKEIFYKLVGEFIIGIDARRLSFANYDERHLGAERLRADAQRIDGLFRGFFEHSEYAMPMITPTLGAIAEIIDLRDKALLTLEASAFVRKYPDIHVDLLTAIIQIREDTNRSESRAIAEEASNNARYHPKGDQEMLKLFQLCRSGGDYVGIVASGVAGVGRRAIPALESTMQHMFATLVMTTTKQAVGGQMANSNESK